MLAQRRRRGSNIEPALAEDPVFNGLSGYAIFNSLNFIENISCLERVVRSSTGRKLTFIFVLFLPHVGMLTSLSTFFSGYNFMRTVQWASPFAEKLARISSHVKKKS